MMNFIEDRMSNEKRDIEAIYVCIDTILNTLKTNLNLPDNALIYQGERDIYIVDLGNMRVGLISHNSRSVTLEIVYKHEPSKTETLESSLSINVTDLKIVDMIDMTTGESVSQLMDRKDLFTVITKQIFDALVPLRTNIPGSTTAEPETVEAEVVEEQ